MLVEVAEVVDMLEGSVAPVVGAMVAGGRGAKWVAGWWVVVVAEPIAARSTAAPARAWCGVCAGVVEGESTMGHTPVWSMVVAMVRVGVVGWCRRTTGRSARQRERARRAHQLRVWCECGLGRVEYGEYGARVCAVRGVLPEAGGRPNGAKHASEPFPSGRPFFAETAMNMWKRCLEFFASDGRRCDTRRWRVKCYTP